jgi:AraC-like DNA-binding protein
MRLPSIPAPVLPQVELPLWPPILATRGKGSRSALHAHHGMHLLLAFEGEIRVRSRAMARWRCASGVLSGPDVLHAIDAQGVDILLIYFDPESDAGQALRGVLSEPIRLLSSDQRDRLVRNAQADAIMGTDGIEWTRRAVATLGGTLVTARRLVHPRVRKLLKILRTMPTDGDRSLNALASAVGLSPSRLMHAFTTSIGVPIRPYLAWLKLQRAGAAIATGTPLSQAAHAAGFADAAHMSRTFRRMLGISPSALRPVAAGNATLW